MRPRRERTSPAWSPRSASTRRVYGYYLRDEPGAGMFPGLAKVADLIRELSPGKWPYINLFPDYANSDQLGTTNYAEYLERFVATCHPSIISYDNYSLMDDGSVRENYWSNLEAVRAAARKHGLEFWNIVLSVGALQLPRAERGRLPLPGLYDAGLRRARDFLLHLLYARHGQLPHGAD